ncbi:MAG TPA: molecular chaperone TorD family protein [Casimicrobiaceae bacterium]|nr:molecular chaperone TorD family protein [Casimicrobiaceae bacterium]
MSSIAPVSIHHRIEPEDRARSDLYALLARLYAAAPDERLLLQIAKAPRIAPEDTPFARAYNRLSDASSAMDADAARQEYFDLFVGVGKCEVNLHASHWLAGFMMERPLVELRADLKRLGVARRADSQLVEDHLALLFETMRLLVAGDTDFRPAELDVQRTFFEAHIGSWVFACCDAILGNSIANYYRCVAELTSVYMAVERDSLVME